MQLEEAIAATAGLLHWSCFLGGFSVSCVLLVFFFGGYIVGLYVTVATYNTCWDAIGLGSGGGLREGEGDCCGD